MITRGAEITLDKDTQLLCQRIADMRYTNNRKGGISNARIGPQSDKETDLQGLGGEIAFAKIAGVSPDLSVHTRSATKGTDKYDLVLPNGETVDIKTSYWSAGHLTATAWKKPTATWSVLMIGYFPHYTFKGAMLTTDLLKPSRLNSLGHGQTYIAGQNELSDLDEL